MKARRVLLLCWLLFSTITAWGQEPSRNIKPQTVRWDRWKWTREEWTADEKPYRRIRNQIDKLIAQGSAPEALAKKYKAQAKSWMNPVDQFRWSYAAYEAVRKANFRGQGRQLQDIEDALREADYAASKSDVASSRNYEYARLRFLTRVRMAPENKLKVVGKRLIDRNLKDHEAMFYFVSVLSPGLHKEDKEWALLYANTLMRALPKKPTVYSLMGEVHYKIWLISNKDADADKAIEFYNKFLNLAPADHPFRDDAKNLVRFIRKLQEHKRKKAQKQ